MPWHAQLQLQYHRSATGQTVLHHKHQGPLRVFKSLYPEGAGVCHNVIIHPPGGLVQGDRLQIEVELGSEAHALISTPGATRFYKSATGELAEQMVRLKLTEGARLEWLPLETLAYNGCEAMNHFQMEIAPGAELMAWDVVSLGLPAAQQPFAQGHFSQHMAWPGVWLERAQIAAQDTRLLHSPVGLDGQTTLATLVLAGGTALTRLQRETWLDCARAVAEAHPDVPRFGITCPNDHMLVARALSDQIEPVMRLWQAIWAAWRHEAWKMPSVPPRIWRV